MESKTKIFLINFALIVGLLLCLFVPVIAVILTHRMIYFLSYIVFFILAYYLSEFRYEMIIELKGGKQNEQKL